MKVDGIEYDLVMLDEFEYVIEFPVRFSGKDEYRIKIESNGLLVPIYFTRKFHRLPKDFQRAVLLVNLRYGSIGMEEWVHNDFGFFWGVKGNGEWTETEMDGKDITNIDRGAAFYLAFNTGKHPKPYRYKYYPTKKEYEQMKKEKRNEKV